MSNSFENMMGGDINTVGSTGLTWGELGAKVFSHGAAGGVMARLQGGKFGSGFAAAGVTEAFAPAIDNIGRGNESYAPARIAAAAVVGGTSSVITGGKFANGAITAAFARAFNTEDHRTGEDIEGVVGEVSDDYPDARIRITGAGRTIERQAELMAQRPNDDLRGTYRDSPHIREMVAWRSAHPGASIQQTATAFEGIIRRAIVNGATVSNHLSDTARDISWPRNNYSQVVGALRARGLNVIVERNAGTGPHLHLDWGR
jgi:hypothetical protein